MSLPRARFYHNCYQPLALACELAAKAFTAGHQAVLRTQDEAAAQQLDKMLWSFSPTSFVPHVRCDSPLAAQTPLVIVAAGSEGSWPSNDLLFNLANNSPPAFQQFRILIEIVGVTESERLPARERWKHYKASGLTLQAFDAHLRKAL